MNRKAQIKEQSNKYNKGIATGFNLGAEWADSHPNWHNYQTDRDFPVNVILHTVNGTYSAEYDKQLNMFMSGGIWERDADIIAWMPLPEFDPKSIE